MSGEREEQLILRVQDKDLADRIKTTLKDDADASASPNIEIHFDGIAPDLAGLHVNYCYDPVMRCGSVMILAVLQQRKGQAGGARSSWAMTDFRLLCKICPP